MPEIIKCMRCETEYEVTRRNSKRRVITKELCREYGNDFPLEEGHYTVTLIPTYKSPPW